MRRSPSSRRSRVLSLVVLVAAVGLVAGACGVTADTTAASVLGRDISIDDVNEIADDEVLVELLFGGAAVSDNESRQSGEVARGVLLFELQRTVWQAELERWGVEVPDGLREEAAASLDQELSSLDQAQPRPDGETRTLSGANRDLLVDFLVVRDSVAQRISRLDVQDPSDLRRLYDGADLQWDQVCLTTVRFSPDQLERAEDALADGATVDDLASRLELTEQTGRVEQACRPSATLPWQLRVAVEAATPGRTSDAIVVGAGASGSEVTVFRVERRDQLSFEEALGSGALIEFAGQIAQNPASWFWYPLAAAEINPRYGQGVGTNLAGQILIEAPEAPVLPRSELFADPAVDQLLTPDATGA
jgi:hypothetical protein